MATMGIPGYEPDFLTGWERIREAHGPRLAALAGRRLTRFALVRFAEDGEWFADCPVVLDFDGVQAELCHWGLDQLALSWNSIDTAAAITGWSRLKRTPQWSGADARLEPFVGSEVREVALLEWQPAGDDLARGMVAVEFVFADGRFRIVNSLDENAVEGGDAHPDFSRKWSSPLTPRMV